MTSDPQCPKSLTTTPGDGWMYEPDLQARQPEVYPYERGSLFSPDREAKSLRVR